MIGNDCVFLTKNQHCLSGIFRAAVSKPRPRTGTDPVAGHQGQQGKKEKHGPNIFRKVFGFFL